MAGVVEWAVVESGLSIDPLTDEGRYNMKIMTIVSLTTTCSLTHSLTHSKLLAILSVNSIVL